MGTSNITPHPSSVTAAQRMRITGSRPCVFWMSGLSGAGKSTIAALFEKKLTSDGHAAYMIDGDTVRGGLCAGLGFSADDRHENLRRIAYLARAVAESGQTVVVCTISPDKQSRDTAREIISQTAQFFEVYVKAPVEVCASRDPKGLYKRAYSGEIKSFTGISAPYEEPEAPELTLDTTKFSAAECADILRAAAIDAIFDPEGLIRSMLHAAVCASAEIMKIYDGDYSVSFKEDSSPLTTADTASNTVLTGFFREHYPEYSILSEEEGSQLDPHGIPERLSNNAGVFIIDPLDGTKEFIHKNGEFCVSIGFAARHRVMGGVIAVPAKRTLYYAFENRGAHKLTFEELDKIQPGQSLFTEETGIRVSDRTDNLIITASRSHGDEATVRLLDINSGRISETITAGSCLKGCLIAEGKADVHYRFGSFMHEWDTAAMQIICSEAGGIYRSIDGRAVPANRSDTVNRDGFVILNRPESALSLE